MCGGLVLALGSLALTTSCQKQDEHPPFAEGCSTCGPLPGIIVGSGTAGSSATPDSDAGPGTLTGEVLQTTDDTFVHAALYPNGAVVTADGASGSPVTAAWDGADAYQLGGVKRAETNWVNVKPNLVGGDLLQTYQAVRTTTVSTVDLAMVSGATLDGVFNAVSSIRSPNFGQVVLFFHSAGTGAPLAGLHVSMPSADVAAYATGTGWTLDDGTAVTSAAGLIVFGNVDGANSAGTQTVSITRAATAGSTPAMRLPGTFAGESGGGCRHHRHGQRAALRRPKRPGASRRASDKPSDVATLIDGKAISKLVREEVARETSRPSRAQHGRAPRAARRPGRGRSGVRGVRAQQRESRGRGRHRRSRVHRLPAEHYRRSPDRPSERAQPSPARWTAFWCSSRCRTAFASKKSSKQRRRPRTSTGCILESIGALWAGVISGLVPCTPRGCMRLIAETGVNVDGRAGCRGRAQ